MSKSQSNMRMSACRRVCGGRHAANHSKLPGLTMYNVLLHGEVRMVVCRLYSQLWVPGRTCVREHPQLSFCLKQALGSHVTEPHRQARRGSGRLFGGWASPSVGMRVTEKWKSREQFAKDAQ
eukprot:313157-Pelagomonas_calceolata.AAC.3